MLTKVVELPFSRPLSQLTDPQLRNGIAFPRINGATELMDGTLFASKLVVGQQTWAHNLQWTATDYNTASWSSGTLQLAGGGTFSISSGNTGNISATTYVYFNQTSTLQTSTALSDALGDGTILLAIVEPDADTDAKCIITAFNSPGTTIDGDKIVTGRIESSDGNTFFDLNNDVLQISDENGTAIIDSTGLVSTANFPSDSEVSLNNTRSTSNDSFTDVSDTSITFSLARSTKVLFLLSGNFANYVADGETCSIYVALDIDGTLYPDSTNGFGNVFFLADTTGYDVSNCLPTWASHYLATLGSGSHTAKLKFRRQGVYSPEVDARVTNTQVTYLILGS